MAEVSEAGTEKKKKSGVGAKKLWRRFRELPLTADEKGRIYVGLRKRPLREVRKMIPSFLDDAAVAASLRKEFKLEAPEIVESPELQAAHLARIKDVYDLSRSPPEEVKPKRSKAREERPRLSGEEIALETKRTLEDLENEGFRFTTQIVDSNYIIQCVSVPDSEPESVSDFDSDFGSVQ